MKETFGARGPMSKVVEKAARFVRACKKSTRAASVFEGHKFSLATSCHTRGDSECDMIVSLVKAHKQDKLQYLPKFPQDPPGARDIATLEEIASAPEPARLFTKQIQVAKGASGMAIPALRMVREMLMANDFGGDGTPAEIFSGILDRRFARVKNSPFYRVAACLDPRFAADADPSDLELLKQAMCVVKSTQMRGGDPQEVTEDSPPEKKKLKGLFGFRKEIQDPALPRTFDELQEFSRRASAVDNEVGLDTGKWYDERKEDFPTLFTLSELYLAPPSSTAEVERVFSITGRVCTPFRARMKTDRIAARVKLNHRMLMARRRCVPGSGAGAEGGTSPKMGSGRPLLL